MDSAPQPKTRTLCNKSPRIFPTISCFWFLSTEALTACHTSKFTAGHERRSCSSCYPTAAGSDYRNTGKINQGKVFMHRLDWSVYFSSSAVNLSGHSTNPPAVAGRRAARNPAAAPLTDTLYRCLSSVGVRHVSSAGAAVEDTLQNKMQFSCFLAQIYCKPGAAAYITVTASKGSLCYGISFHLSTIKEIERK